jgi:ribosome-associated translation inhibitor RaiA
MVIAIQSRGFSMTEAIEEHVQRRLGFTLSRGVGRVQRVSVKLSDINGPRGGVDKRCLIQIKLGGLPQVVVEDVQPDLYAAIDRAASRAGRAVMRRLALSQGRRRSANALSTHTDRPEL